MSLHEFVVLPSVRLYVLSCVCVCMPLSLALTLLTFLSHAQSRLVFYFSIFHCLCLCVLCLSMCVFCLYCLFVAPITPRCTRSVCCVHSYLMALSFRSVESCIECCQDYMLLQLSLHSTQVSMSVSPSQHCTLHGRSLSSSPQDSDSLIDRADRSQIIGRFLISITILHKTSC